MAIGGAFLGGGVEVVPAGSCKLELEILTEDRKNLTATFTIKGTSTDTVTAGADGRAVYTVPSGQTYAVSVNTTGYDNIASQTVVAESGTVRYVRFEAFAGRVKRSGDTMTNTLGLIYNRPVIRLRSTEFAYSDPVSESTTVFALMMNDKNDAFMGGLFNRWYSNGDRKIYLENKGKDGKMGQISLWTNASGVYAEAPTPSNSTDNSTAIATTAWVTQASSVVHTDRDELIQGVKTFLQNPIVLRNSPYVILKDTKYALTDDITDNYNYGCIPFKDKNGKDIGRFTVRGYTDGRHRIYYEIFGRDGTSYSGMGVWLDANGKAHADAPTTPSGATGSEIATANWCIGKFVQKSGDTMTGNLTINRAGASILALTNSNHTVSETGQRFMGRIDGKASDGTIGDIEFLRNTPSGYQGSAVSIHAYNNVGTTSTLVMYSFDDGVNQEAYVQHPSWKVGTDDNSDKSLTIKMANKLPSLVHTSNNEVINGFKAVTEQFHIRSPHIASCLTPEKNQVGTRLQFVPNDVELTKYQGYIGQIVPFHYINYTSLALYANRKDSSGTMKYVSLEIRVNEDGTTKATAPTTPTNATSNEIATADWVNTKLAQKSKVTAVTSYTQLIELIKNGKRGDSFGLTMDYTGGSFGDIVITSEAVEIHAFGHYTLEELTVTDGNLSSFQAFGSGEVSGTFFKDDSSTYIYATTGFGRSRILQGYADALRIVEDGKLTYFLTDDETTTSFDGYYISI